MVCKEQPHTQSQDIADNIGNKSAILAGSEDGIFCLCYASSTIPVWGGGGVLTNSSFKCIPHPYKLYGWDTQTLQYFSFTKRSLRVLLSLSEFSVLRRDITSPTLVWWGSGGCPWVQDICWPNGHWVKPKKSCNCMKGNITAEKWGIVFTCITFGLLAT